MNVNIMQVMLSNAEQLVLEALVQNSRNTPNMIGLMVGKSRNWVSRTIKGLVKSGVIRAYTTTINPNFVQGARGILLFMKSNPREGDVSEKLLAMKELESLDGISGDYSLLGYFRQDHHGSFEDLLDRVDRVVASSGAGKYNLVQVLTGYKKNGFRIIKTEQSQSPLSEKELALLRILYRYRPTIENPHPFTQAKIGSLMEPMLSQSAVSKALEKLTLKRAIVGHSIDIDFSLIGLPVKFVVRIKVNPGTASAIAQKMIEDDAVWDLYRTSEDYSLLAIIRTDTIANFNRFLRNLYNNESVLDTRSYITLEEWFVPIH